LRAGPACPDDLTLSDSKLRRTSTGLTRPQSGTSPVHERIFGPKAHPEGRDEPGRRTGRAGGALHRVNVIRLAPVTGGARQDSADQLHTR